MSSSERELRNIIKNLQATLSDDLKRVPHSFFDKLCIECTNPKRLYEVFQNFIYSILTEKNLQINRSAALDCIFRAIRKSHFLLDSLLSALYIWNLQPNEFNQFHKYLNEEFTQKDWSFLRTPSIVKQLPESNDLKNISGHPINRCIYEIVFSHTQPDILAHSQFINIPIESTLDLLSDKSLNNFADALIIQFLNQPLEIFKKLENKKKNFIIDDENKLAIAIFRSRDIKDIELYTDEQIYDDEEFESIIQNSGLNFDTIIYLFLKKTLTFNNHNPKSLYDPSEFLPKIKSIFNQLSIQHPKDKLFPFFSILVLPNADYFDDTFIQKVIKCSIFPSSDPNFPDQLFNSSEQCQKFITIKVLFDIYKKTGTENLKFEESFDDAYQNIIIPSGNDAEEYRIEMVMESIFSTYSPKTKDTDSKIEKTNSFVSHVFLWFISNKTEITPFLMHRCIASHINHYYEAICELTLCAIEGMVKIDLFLNAHTLSAFFDQIFANVYLVKNTSKSDENDDVDKPNIDPKLGLNVLYQISIKQYENPEVISFWNENISVVIDAIMTSHPLTAELLRFLHDFLANANKEFLNQILSVFIDDLDVQSENGNELTMQVLKQFLNME